MSTESQIELEQLSKFAAIASSKVYTSHADLDPKDHPMQEMLDWCEKQGDIVVMRSGLILSSNPSSRSVQNCKIVMGGKGLRAGKVVPTTSALVRLLLAGAKDEEADKHLDPTSDPQSVSLQQQRLRMLVAEGIREQISDIHLEVREDATYVRFRRHGELYLHTEWPARVGREVSAVAFNRETDHAITHFNPLVPQNASMPLHIEDMDIRLRLASLPAHGGFDVVMRILTTGHEQSMTLDELGYTADQIKLIHRATQMPYGTVLVAGPTGSGKTTTLAACMQMISDDRKIYTIEDPVEKLISNATQVPVNTEKEDRDFAGLGRAALRMDPDVIVLGELRDEDTARVMMRASITGHLVFSTIHTNNATAIVTRLVDMGISQNLLGDPNVLVCLICQRLLPKLCLECAVPVTQSAAHQPNLQRWAEVFGDKLSQVHVRGKHCKLCNHTGISGRTVVAEVIWIDEQSRYFIQKCDILGWEKYLKEQGWSGYPDQVLRLVSEGVCDPVDAEKLIGDLSALQTHKMIYGTTAKMAKEYSE